MIGEIAIEGGRTETRRGRAVDSLERVRVQGVDQWVLVRSTHADSPVLLILQAGPGFPMINEAEEFNRATHLEDEFTVVYWDERGCGKSYDPSLPSESITLEQYVRDTTELTEVLRTRFGRKQITLLGFSMGGTIAMLAGASRPDWYDAVIAVGPDIDGADAGTFAYDFALAEARRRSNRRAEADLLRIGPPPHVTVAQFSTRVKWVANFGGIRRGASFGRLRNETIWSLLRSPHYSLGDVFKTIKGMTFAQQHLLGEMAHWDLRGRVQPGELPLHIFQGRWDKAANPGVAGAFSPNVIWFEESAHAPQYEESEKFRAELLRIHGTGRLPGNVPGE